MLPPGPTYESNSEPYCDYYGFPSFPFSIYHTGDKWPVPTGFDAWRTPREARPICNHPVQAVWHTLGEQVYKFLDSLGVLWTTIDPVRFALDYTDKEAGPLFLWVGVKPGSLSLEAAKAAATGCKEILTAAQFPDIKIAFRESIFTRTFGPKLLDHVRSFTFTQKPIDDLRSPFTGMLGVPITPWSTPQSEGTGALYLREGGKDNRIFLLTARHVVLPPSVYPNEHFERKGRQPRHNVLILGSTAYSDAVTKMEVQIAHEVFNVDYSRRQLGYLGEAVEGEDDSVAKKRQSWKNKLVEAEKTLLAVDELHSHITKNWSVLGRRRLGHVVYAPPISVCTDSIHLSEDWALIEVDPAKLGDDFKGNVIYLGNKISFFDFLSKMHLPSSDFPLDIDSLLQLKGVVKEEELRQPTLLDTKGEQCIIVMKNGKSTRITIGRGTNLESFVRECHDDGIKSTSMEFAIYAGGYKPNGAFSSPGDSGSVVVDGTGRIVGMLIGGAGNSDKLDVSYFTLYFWLEKQIQKVFPDSHLYPVQEQAMTSESCKSCAPDDASNSNIPAPLRSRS